ncbi:six-hairpin glycosidase [Echinicola jeungdonensis]|uniref:Six-hairpin glycosidase n=1 Tax=Echinicola jeungdonensis TaxID=709343 RepID=A0ABV5J3Q7_9BACT|nr:six-hairpin glycosidase [Echinicola jeungdonensis]MDN3669358.1 six-hairpin glycosidase [Echinicola jeungdonensis]
MSYNEILNNNFKKLFAGLLMTGATLGTAEVMGQDTLHYSGETLSRVDYHHGQLQPAVGVHAIQTMRANRQQPDKADGFGWTYNHAPMLAYWNGTFFMEYLSDPVGEHIPPGQTLLQTSKDGYNWTDPEVIFPPYRIPDGTTKENYEGVAKDLDAVMHQRMGFYVASNNKFLALAYYGIALDAHDGPNDGHGIGRVVREINEDGSFGPIHFIRYNDGWNEDNTDYPFYKDSKDKAFVKACDELLSKPLMMQQWVEEADRDDPLIPLQKQYKAFSYYHLPDGRVVGLWKHALTSVSHDGGETWEYNPLRAPGVVNGNAKIWGQRTDDGAYATVYNPSEYRWPLAVSTSQDGLDYTDLLLVHGEITSMRYGGNYKSYGPQYVRGILEGNGNPPDNKMWLTYSVNKEDIWVASVPTPITAEAAGHANEVFNEIPDGSELDLWNIYSPAWARVEIEKDNEGNKWLAFNDKDPFDYGKAQRIVPESEQLHVEFTVKPEQNDHGKFQIEFRDAKGRPGVQLIFDEDGKFKTRSGYRMNTLTEYEAGEEYHVELELDASTRFYQIKVNGENKGPKLFFAPLDKMERVMFRTGTQRYFPTAETPTDQDYDLEDPGREDPEAKFYLKSLITY